MSGDADKAMIETARRLAEGIYARWWNLGGVSKDRRKIMAEHAALAALAALRPGDRLPSGLVVVREDAIISGVRITVPASALFAPDSPAKPAQGPKDGDDPLGR